MKSFSLFFEAFYSHFTRELSKLHYAKQPCTQKSADGQCAIGHSLIFKNHIKFSLHATKFWLRLNYYCSPICFINSDFFDSMNRLSQKNE